MLMPWCDICILETSRRYVEYLLDITACMHAEQTFRGRGRKGGTSGSSSVEQGRLNRRGTGTCYCTMKNSSTCFNRPVFVCSFVCTLVGQGSSTKPSRPTDRELKIRMRIEMGPILIHIRVSMCAHHSVQQPCLFVGEERYRPLK